MRYISVVAVVLFAAAAAFAQESGAYFTHGPMLGRLGSESIAIWARTAQPGQFAVRYGTSPDQLDQLSPVTQTPLADDNTGWIELKNLNPATRYYYVLVIPGVVERSGRSGTFRTLPSSEAMRDAQLNPRGLFNFSFEFACGNNQNPEHSIGPSLPAFETMLREIAHKIDFAILNGDWLYESQREYTPQQWLAQMNRPASDLPAVVRVAPTLTGVWQNYKHFLTQAPNLARWHAVVPSYFTYDDHEILNDIWGTGTPGLRDRRAVFRDIGVHAWYDYLGWANETAFTQEAHFGRGTLTAGGDEIVDEGADFTKLDLKQMSNLHVHWGTPTAGINDNTLDGVGGEKNAGVYGIVKVLGPHRLQITPAAKADGEVDYSIGRRSYFRKRVGNCDFFFVDTRGHREMHDVRRPDKPGLSMLGQQQLQWLIDGMKQSDADFFFVISSVNFMVPHVGGGKIREGANKDEAWTVFLEEREKLINFWDDMKQPVFVLTGDLHNSFAIKVTDNVWEFASGPHNSNNHWASDEGDRPANGSFSHGGREVEIRWSSWFLSDIPRDQLLHPTYCVVQVNNVFNNPRKLGDTRWVAYPRPQVIFQYYDGRTGELKYAESILAAERE